MTILKNFLVAAIVAAAAAAHAEDDKALLIQVAKDGGFRVWHSAGATSLNDDEALALAASAKPDGGETIETDAGPAKAYDTTQGVVVEVPGAKTDHALLIDRDNCGAVKVWHSEGATNLNDDQLTELMLTALPGGGASVPLGDKLGRSYTTELGVIALIWKPILRGGARPTEPSIKPPSSAR